MLRISPEEGEVWRGNYILEKAATMSYEVEDRPALTADQVEAGVALIRDWLGWNWSEIKEGAEPEIRELSRALLSLGRSHARPDR